MKLIPISLGLLIIGGGTVLRVNEALHNDIWYDEAFTGIVIQQSWSDIVKTLIEDRNHPPLFYALLKIVTWITGSTDPLHLRLVSLFFGIATIPLGYSLIQQLNLEKEEKKWLGIATMAVLSFSPFFVSYSTEARSYALLLFLMLISIIYFIKASNNSFKLSKELVILVVMLIIIMITHFLSALILSGAFVAFLLIKMEENKALYNSDLMKKIGVIIFLGWILSTWSWSSLNMGAVVKQPHQMDWIPHAELAVIPKTITDFLFGVHSRELGFPPANTFSFPLLMGNIGFVILITSVIAFVIVLQKSIKNPRKLRDIIILTSLWIVPLVIDILASSFGVHMYIDRYMIGYGAMLIIWMLYVWWNIASKHIALIISIYLTLLLFVVRAPYLTRYSEVVNLIPSGSLMTIESPIDYLVFKYYLPESNIKLLKQTSGQAYLWPLMPESIQITQNEVMPSSLIVIHKSADRKIPPTWQQKFRTNDFRVYSVLKFK